MDKELHMILIPFSVFIVFMLVLMILIPLKRKMANDALPLQTEDAKVVAKREDVSYVYPGKHADATSVYPATEYYVTFQIGNGERREFAVKGKEYGMLVEGDVGRLTFRGIRYLGFLRDAQSSEL